MWFMAHMAVVDVWYASWGGAYNKHTAFFMPSDQAHAYNATLATMTAPESNKSTYTINGRKSKPAGTSHTHARAAHSLPYTHGGPPSGITGCPAAPPGVRVALHQRAPRPQVRHHAPTWGAPRVGRVRARRTGVRAQTRVL